MNIAQYYKELNLLFRMQLDDPNDYFWEHSKIHPETISGTQTVIYLGYSEEEESVRQLIQNFYGL